MEPVRHPKEWEGTLLLFTKFHMYINELLVSTRTRFESAHRQSHLNQNNGRLSFTF
jgi:hypothetical protein